MDTKNCTWKIFAGLVFTIVLTVYFLSADTMSVFADELKQVVPEEPAIEEVKPQEALPPSVHIEDTEKVSPAEEAKPVVEVKPHDEPISAEKVETQTAEETTSAEDTSEQAVSAEAPSVEVSAVEQTVCTEEKPSHAKPSKRYILQKYINKISCAIKQKITHERVASLRYFILHHIATPTFFKNMNNRRVKNITCKSLVPAPDVIPYYYINPKTSLENKDIKNVIFPEKIESITELMPYHVIVQNIPVKIDCPKMVLPHEGTTDTLFLMNAPCPQVSVNGDDTNAKLVIDIHNNTLYKYDKKGFPLKAYPVATGARGMRTMPGLRIVTYKERFPYSGAPNSKRALDPYSYGPYIIFLNIVDPKTGRQSTVEQLLHGNGNEASIGRKVSHGCIRTNNTVMSRELSKEVKRGDYILLINPDVD